MRSSVTFSVEVLGHPCFETRWSLRNRVCLQLKKLWGSGTKEKRTPYALFLGGLVYATRCLEKEAGSDLRAQAERYMVQTPWWQVIMMIHCKLIEPRGAFA